MLNNFRLIPTREVTLRILADILMVSLSVLAALFVRYLYLVMFETARAGEDYRALLFNYLRAYASSIWLLVLISIIVFAVSGFYTRGRAYQGRYKVLVVAQAVSISFLIFAFIAYVVFRDFTQFPRAALIIAWGITLVVVVAARMWAYLWNSVVRTEWYLLRPEERPRIQQVLVIGGAGYIGSALLPKLLENGYRVRLLDLLLYGKEPIQDVIHYPNLEIMKADFRQVDKVVEAMRGVDAVIHLGALVGDPACALDEDLTIEINVMATRMIAEVAKGSDVSRFIFASTCSVYGANDLVLDERSVLNPVSLYARSKLASEDALQKMADDRFSPVILRFGTVYGLSGRTRFDLVVNLLAAKAAIDNQITIYGGDQWRPFLHVDDAAATIVKVLGAPRRVVHNQVYNVGFDEQNYTIRQVGEIIHNQVPDAEMIVNELDSDRRNYRVNFGKLKSSLEVTPAWTVEMGACQVIEAVHRGEITDYRQAKYSNVRYLEEEGLLDLLKREHRWLGDLVQPPIAVDRPGPSPVSAALGGDSE